MSVLDFLDGRWLIPCAVMGPFLLWMAMGKWGVFPDGETARAEWYKIGLMSGFLLMWMALSYSLAEWLM